MENKNPEKDRPMVFADMKAPRRPAGNRIRVVARRLTNTELMALNAQFKDKHRQSHNSLEDMAEWISILEEAVRRAKKPETKQRWRAKVKAVRADVKLMEQGLDPNNMPETPPKKSFLARLFG